MVERTRCPAEGWGLTPRHLADVQRLVLVVQVSVALVGHGGDVENFMSTASGCRFRLPRTKRHDG